MFCCLCLFLHRLQSFSFSFLATKRSNLHTRAEKGSCRPQWVLQAQLFPLRLGSPGTNQLALRDIRSRSFIGQVRTYNLFYTQGHRGCGLGLAMLRDRNWWCWESRMFNSHQREESWKSPREDQGVLITWTGVISEATRKDGGGGRK